MSAPTPYLLSFDFTSFQSANPTSPLPADRIEIEYNNLQVTTDGLIANLALIQRADGELANESVGVSQLRPEIAFGLNSVSNWTTATAYSSNDGIYGPSPDNNGIIYRALSPHTSGTFSVDLASGRWEELVDHRQFVTQSANSASAAATSETNAAASETNAAASETIAEAAEMGAAASAVSASMFAAQAANAASAGLYETVTGFSFADSPIAPTVLQEGNLFKIDTTAGVVVINLSTLAAYGEDMKFAFVRDAGSNDIIINRGGTDTINGGTSITISDDFETHVVVGDLMSGQWVDSVQAASVSPNSITTVELADGAVMTDNVSDGAVTNTKIAPDTITGSRIAPETITGSRIAPDTITNSLLADDIIFSSNIHPDAIATEAEALAGTNNTKLMTPLRVATVMAAAPPPSSPFTQQYTSPQTAYANAADTVFAHPLGVVPELVTLRLINVIAEHGYSVGQQADVPLSAISFNQGVTAILDGANVTLRVGAGGLLLVTSGTTTTAATPANWQMVLRVWA